jgi:hypothetical protein
MRPNREASRFLSTTQVNMSRKPDRSFSFSESKRVATAFIERSNLSESYFCVAHIQRVPHWLWQTSICCYEPIQGKSAVSTLASLSTGTSLRAL